MRYGSCSFSYIIQVILGFSIKNLVICHINRNSRPELHIPHLLKRLMLDLAKTGMIMNYFIINLFTKI